MSSFVTGITGNDDHRGRTIGPWLARQIDVAIIRHEITKGLESLDGDTLNPNDYVTMEALEAARITINP